MQYGIRLEQAIEKVREHFSVVAWEQQPQCVGRARSQAVPSKAHYLTSPPHAMIRPLLSSIQIVNCQYRMSVLNNCASLYMFCN